MSEPFEAVLRPGWRIWLATAFFALTLMLDVAIVVVVCLVVSGSDRAWIDWVLAALLCFALLFLVVRGVRQLILNVHHFLRRPYPVMLRVDAERVRVASGLDRGGARFAEVSWDDVAAVVASRAAGGGGLRKVACVQFVPIDPGSLELEATKASRGWKARTLGLGPQVAPLAWLVGPGVTPGLQEAMVHIRRLAPDHVRVLDSCTDADAGLDLKQA